MATYTIKKASNQNDLASLACQTIASHIAAALHKRERIQIAVSGGSTPRDTYRLLAQEYLPWDRVDLFLGDERWVSHNDEGSNARMIRKTLLASSPGNMCRFHIVPTVELLSPEESAKAFSRMLKKTCIGTPPIFDLILLGLGDDGHTASLFPESHSLTIKDTWTTVGSVKGVDRITLTAPVLSAARKVFFLVSGASKYIALKRLLDPSESVHRTPARLVQPCSEITILADDAAASLV